jgi:hypothetical protein
LIQTFDRIRLFFMDGAKIGFGGSVDIPPRHGLETAGLGRHGRQRDKAHFATFGLSSTAFQKL